MSAYVSDSDDFDSENTPDMRLSQDSTCSKLENKNTKSQPKNNSPSKINLDTETIKVSNKHQDDGEESKSDDEITDKEEDDLRSSSIKWVEISKSLGKKKEFWLPAIVSFDRNCILF